MEEAKKQISFKTCLKRKWLVSLVLMGGYLYIDKIYISGNIFIDAIFLILIFLLGLYILWRLVEKNAENKKGFSIAELIIAISIFAVLAVLTMVAVNPLKRMGEGNDARRWEDVTAIAKAVEAYQIDNDSLPSDLTGLNINASHKVVLCSSASSLTCDGQTRDCLVVDDADFIGVYLDALPIAPGKSATTDTGYYITNDNQKMTFGACSTYASNDIEYIAQASMATYASTCGDGVVEGNEVCDDGDTFGEGCGNATLETAGTYCSSDCSIIVTLSVDETCDSDFNNSCYNSPTGMYYYTGGYVYASGSGCKTSTMCSSDCSDCTAACI